MNQNHVILRLLREVRRVERLARHLAEPVDPAEAWVAFHTFTPESKDAPGWLDRLMAPATHRVRREPYGDVVRFERDGFFITGRVPFTGIALPDGGGVVAFRAMVRKDLAPVVLRFAAERLWAAHGWRFPEDLTHPVAFAAVLELAFAGDYQCRYRPTPGTAAREAEGYLPLEAIAPPYWRDDNVQLRWGPKSLGFYSDRFGWF